MTTQWRMVSGMRERVTGLDYSVVPHVMNLLGVKRSERRDTFNRLRFIEAGALNELNKH